MQMRPIGCDSKVFIMSFKNILGAAAIAAVFFSAGQASATTLTFHGLEINPAATVNIAGSNRTGGFYAGGFSMTQGADNFVAWCIDVAQNMIGVGSSADYTEGRPTHVSAESETYLSRLFTSYGEVALDSATNSAAFQVAIWEIVYDQSTLDLAVGEFSASDRRGSLGVTGLAQTWLDNLGTDSSGYELTFYANGRSQDLVTGMPSPVPLPAGGLLLLVGLGGLAALRRRKRTE